MLATPEINVRDYAVALNTLSESFSAIQSQTGDLTFQLINQIQTARANAEIAYAGLVSDAAISASLVQDFVAERGGPANNAATVAAQSALVTALDAWGGVVLTAARSATSTELVVVSSRSFNGVTLNTIGMSAAIPATYADPIRTGAEANAVVAALTSLGA